MMKVVEALNCVKCGSNNLSCNDGFFICEYCNTKHVLVNDSLVKVFEKNELYKTADLYFEWRQYDIASEKYKEIVYKWAYESLAWWGIVKCMTENFLKIEISEDYYKNIEKYAVRAFETADPTTRVDLESQWKMYTNQVSSLFNTKKEKIKADVENKRLEQEEKMRQNVYVAFLGMKEEEEKKISGVVTAISVVMLILINITYTIFISCLDIDGTIYSSPNCIVPIVIGGFVATLLAGLFSGISKFFGLFWLPSAINAVSVILMISGMISHNQSFFLSVIVVLCFGVVGVCVTALMGWLSWILANGMKNNYDASYFAHKYVEHKFKKPLGF